MMRGRIVFIAAVVGLLLLGLGSVVLAQEEVPSPYAGSENPFPWGDTSAQEVGRGLYQQSCLGCHGVEGNNLAKFDFSAADYPQRLEERPDLYFWVLSEGRLDKGMPPYKSSLSEDQRWQLLTYLWTLGAEVSPPSAQPPADEDRNILLTVPEQAQSGQPMTISASLQDKEGKPVVSARMEFFIEGDFFASGLMEIGDALTNAQGVAVFEFTPRQTGETRVVARYQAIESAATLTLIEADEPLYHAEAGMRLPAPGTPVFIGPASALELGEGGTAPTSAFYLPGGILSWLLVVVVAVIFIWFTYFRVIYQVFRIPIVGEIEDTDTRLIPLIGLVMVSIMGLVLALMLITGPYSHFHLVQ